MNLYQTTRAKTLENLESTQTYEPGSVIGILGGGQLGRMTALAAATLGYRCHIFTTENSSPASQVSEKTTVGSYLDNHALAEFANDVDIITYEFENIPLETVEYLSKNKPVRPAPSVLAISQHRALEKDFAIAQGIPVAPYQAVSKVQDLKRAATEIGFPAVLKSCRFGYDGKGQKRLDNEEQIEPFWSSLTTNDAILERHIPFTKEISVIVARGQNGEVRTYPAVENVHVNHILYTTTAPAQIPEETARNARNIAVTLAKSLNLIGLLAVEMFLMPDGSLLMNEVAPRPHNSGHWTQDGAKTSQFEQLIRAITGQALGPTKIIEPIVMQNLIGDDYKKWRFILAEPEAKLHLYGKSESRPGRKMGHVNRSIT